jgi:small subunit ribosomal protein S15
MHTRRRGSSGSDRPAADDPPEWSDVDEDAIVDRVVDLAEEGHAPSEIGMKLRADLAGGVALLGEVDMKLRDEGVDGTPVPDVSLATGRSITEILEVEGAGPDLPEDLRNLMERAVGLHEHMDANPNDHQNKRALQNTESKIRRLVEYYRGDELDEDFTYSGDTVAERLE